MTAPVKRPTLVPEFSCQDAEKSLNFYTEVLGFSVRYNRPNTGFYYLERDGAEIMIEQKTETSWISAPTEPPYGRGMSLQITTTDLAELYKNCCAQTAPIFREWEEAWYRRDDLYVGQVQFIVADPDGYLLRFAEDLGTRQNPPTSTRIVS